MNTDLAYALKQLRGINLKNLNHAGQYNASDRVQRAIDALSRMEAEEKRDPETDKRADASVLGRIVRL